MSASELHFPHTLYWNQEVRRLLPGIALAIFGCNISTYSSLVTIDAIFAFFDGQPSARGAFGRTAALPSR